MEDDDGALQQGMEGDDAGIHQDMEAGHAGNDQAVEADMEDAWLEEAVEDGGGAIQGMEAGDAGLEEAMEDEDGAIQGIEAGDAGLEEAMEDEDGAIQGMEAGGAGLEEAMEDEDGAVEQDMVEGDDAGVEQGMEHDDDAVIDLDQFIQEMGGGVTLLPHNHVLPMSIPAYEASPVHLLLQWNEFRRSGPLESIVLLADRDEEDGDGDGPPETVGPLFRDGDYRSIDTVLPEGTLELIRETFNARTHATIEALLLDGRRMQFDFLRKICVEVDEEGTPLRTIPMYWVDDQYRVFVSARIFGMDEQVVRQQFTEECRGRLLITRIRRCFHRLHAMTPFCERMQVQRPVFGWYGAEAELVEHGAFEDEALHTNWERVELRGGERAYGRGVHIASMRRIMQSALLSMVGTPLHQECHMLLCALAPGMKEIVPEGSTQDSPSNPLFQSGVVLDELGNPSPKWYLIWETSDPGGVLQFRIWTLKCTERFNLHLLWSVSEQTNDPLYS